MDRPHSETEEKALHAVERAEALLSWPERIRRWATVYVAAIVTGIAGGLGYLVVEHSGELHQATISAQSAAYTAKIIRGCFQPESPCARLNEKANSKAFKTLAQIIVLADQCQADPRVGSSFPAQEACLAHQMQIHGLG